MNEAAIKDEMPPLDLIDELAMLLSAVAAAAAKTGVKEAQEVIATDKHAQAHFVAFSVHLREMTGLDAAIIEYAKTTTERTTKFISSGDQNTAGWPVWKRIV